MENVPLHVEVMHTICSTLFPSQALPPNNTCVWTNLDLSLVPPIHGPTHAAHSVHSLNSQSTRQLPSTVIIDIKLHIKRRNNNDQAYNIIQDIKFNEHFIPEFEQTTNVSVPATEKWLTIITSLIYMYRH